jgi:UDP-N-acetylglucosamine 4-epimerase
MDLKKYHNYDLSQSTFLVTGGAGFIGSHLVEYLLKHDAGKVRVLDNFSTGSIDNLLPFQYHSTFELLDGDIRDSQTCETAMEGIDYVLHQAALGSVPRSIADPLTTNDVNITGFLNILIAAQKANVKRMVYAASSSTYGDSKELPKVEDKIGKPLSPYAVTKYVNELYADVFARSYNFNTIGLRYFNVFGPRQNPMGAYAAVIPLFIKAALSNDSPVINGDGLTSRDFTFIDNVIQANIKALFYGELSAHEVFNIACNGQTTLNELWQYISGLAGVEITAGRTLERRGDVRQSLASIDKAKSLLMYQPEVMALDGLQKTFDWYKLNLKLNASY